MMLDDDDLYEDLPPPKKTGKATASKTTSRSTATSRSKASSQPKKAPAKGRGRKKAATVSFDLCNLNTIYLNYNHTIQY